MSGNKTRRKKIQMIIIGVVLLALAALIALVAVFSQRNTPENTPPHDGSGITVDGEYVCLPKEDGGGQTQTLECALGLRTDDNLYYALQFEDESPADFQTGKRLHITGTFYDVDQSQYVSIGKIVVSEAEQLD